MLFKGESGSEWAVLGVEAAPPGSREVFHFYSFSDFYFF